jgi:hypothetical protein
MAQRQVGITIKIDGKDIQVTEQSLQELYKTGQVTKKEFDFLTQSLGGLNKAMKSTEKGTKDLNKGLDETKKKAKEAKEQNVGLLDGLESMPGATGRAVGGVRALGAQFTKLLANPIVLLIAAITAAIYGLFKAFTSTKAGSEKWGQMMAGLGAIMDVVRDRAVKLFEAFGKLFTLDFKGFFNDAKEALSGVGDEMIREAKLAAEYEKQLQKVKDRERELSVERAKTAKDIAAVKVIINDTNKSYADRIKALELVRQKEVELAKQEEATAKAKYENLKGQMSLSDSSAAQLDELAQAEADYYNKSTASFNIQKELGDQIIMLKQQQTQAAKDYANNVTDLNTKLIEDDVERGRQELKNQAAKEIQSYQNLQISQNKKNELIMLANQVLQKQLDDYDEKIQQEKLTKIEEFEQQTQALRIKLIEDQFERERSLALDNLNNQKKDLQKSLDDKLIDQAQYNDRLLLLEKEYQMSLKQIKKSEDEEDKQNKLDAFDEQLRLLELENSVLLEGTAAYYDNLRSIENTAYERRKEAAAGNASELEIIERQHKQNLINISQQELIAQKTIQLERLQSIANLGKALQSIAGENKKLAIAGIVIEKAAAIGQIVANTAIANAKSVAASPITGGQPWVAINSITAGISIGATIAAAIKAISEINSGGSSGSSGPSQAQQGASQGLTGRRYERGGMIGGRRHAQGGTMIEAEAGEAIINRNSVGMFAPLLSAINQAGGGVPLTREAQSMASPDNPTTRNIPQERQVQILKSYVVEQELTQSQQKQARLKELSTL